MIRILLAAWGMGRGAILLTSRSVANILYVARRPSRPDGLTGSQEQVLQVTDLAEAVRTGVCLPVTRSLRTLELGKVLFGGEEDGVVAALPRVAGLVARDEQDVRMLLLQRLEELAVIS